MSRFKTILLFLSPVFLSFILHFSVFNLDLIGIHVWRQAQTQTVIYNFVFSENNIFHPQRFDLSNGNSLLLYEFPLYQWLVAQTDLLLGYEVWHSRCISFIIFIFLLNGFYKLIRNYVTTITALASNAFLCFSPLLYYYCINPLPDTLALTLAVWSLKFWIDYQKLTKPYYLLLALFFLMLAALVKLPFVLYGTIAFPVIWKYLKEKNYNKLVILMLITALFLLPVFIWYSRAIPTWKGNGITSGLMANNKSILELLDYLWFHLVSTVPELICNYAAFPFLITGIYFFIKNRKFILRTHHSWVILFVFTLAYLIFEVNMIEKSHDYYLLPFVPLIFMVLTYGLNKITGRKKIWLLATLLSIAPLTAWLRIQHRWDVKDPGFNRTYAEHQKTIQSIIPQNAHCIVDYDDSHFIVLYYLKRFGYSLYRNEISQDKIKDCYLKGARYLITENRGFDPTMYVGIQMKEIYSNHLKVYKLQLP